MDKKQQGATMLGMLLVGGLIVFGAIMALKLIPPYIEYATIRNHLRDMAKDSSLHGATVRDIGAAFNRRAQIDNISAVSGADLDVSREGGEFVISTEYAVRVKLVGNVSACIDFEVSSE